LIIGKKEDIMTDRVSLGHKNTCLSESVRGFNPSLVIEITEGGIGELAKVE